MKTLTLIISLLAVGCTAPDESAPAPFQRSTIIKVEPELSPYLAEIQAAGAIWIPVGGILVIDDNETQKTMRCATSDLHAAAITFPDGISYSCKLLANVEPEVRFNVFAHEIGHTFGCLHVEDPFAIMTGETLMKHPHNDITQADIDEFNRANGQNTPD